MQSIVTAGPPVIDDVKMPGVTRGTTATIEVHGSGLADAIDMVVDVPGVEVLSVKSKNDKLAAVELKTAVDIKPGLYPFWVMSKTGMSNMRFLGIGQYPIVRETEPNQTNAQAQTIDLGTTVEGVIQREDVDQFKVSLEAGRRLCLEVEGLRLQFTLRNQNIFDPSIAISDANGFELATSDDFALWQQDGVCEFTAEEAGDYFVSVRDSSFNGNKFANYRLHVGNFPRPIAIVPHAPPRGPRSRPPRSTSMVHRPN